MSARVTHTPAPMTLVHSLEPSTHALLAKTSHAASENFPMHQHALPIAINKGKQGYLEGSQTVRPIK